MEYIDKRLAISGGVILFLLLLSITLYQPYTGIDLGKEYILADIKPTEAAPLPPLQIEVYGFE